MPKIVAALGPTNTGKTYLAFERMLGYGSGVMGFPLRLLARENYDRAVAIKGQNYVALLTGEEKIVPPYAKYFFCTVESMPQGKKVDFVAVDEIQMCADPDRGHIFTDRLFEARGRQETMFLGSETVAPLLKRLIPSIEIIDRCRFSTLSYSGAKNLVRLRPRSAVVGFSASTVYAVAEIIRRQRGGAAIVMGALSPRTRNAQVNLFQNGDVDYLVATDAIGMGLNMDVNHVAFSASNKFDGRIRRTLFPAEMAQIAGRAGRYMNDGTFGVTGELRGLSPQMIKAIEEHRFDPLKFIYWRNPQLDFTSIDSLISSLNQLPVRKGLVKIYRNSDERFLRKFSQSLKVLGGLTSAEDVRLIWEICQIPDYKKTIGNRHIHFLFKIHKYLCRSGCLPTDWVATEIDRLDKRDGDIDTLMNRIAGIRVWTYITHREGWLNDPIEWQQRTRAIEDGLSDALHQGLTQRFVDKRTAILVKSLNNNEKLRAGVKVNGDVIVEGHLVGKLDGFQFVPVATDSEISSKVVRGAALRALRHEIPRRIEILSKDLNTNITLSKTGCLVWRGSYLAKLVRGDNPLRPKLKLITEGFLDSVAHNKAEKRLNSWVSNHIEENLSLFHRLRNPLLKGLVGGLAFQLVDNLGFLPRIVVNDQLRKLSKLERGQLRRIGVKIGREEVFVPIFIKPRIASLLAILWAVYNELETIPPLPIPGVVSIPLCSRETIGFYRSLGFRKRGPLLIRVDILERLVGQVKSRASKGSFFVDQELLSLVGCNRVEMEGVLSSLGYISRLEGKNKKFEKNFKNSFPRSKKKTYSNPGLGNVGNESPFAVLRGFVDRS